MLTRATLLALLLLVPAHAVAAAAPWSAPRSITVRGVAREPVVALGGPDTAAVGYVRSFGGADRAELRRGTLTSLRSPAILQRDPSHTLDSPALTFDGGDALFA